MAEAETDTSVAEVFAVLVAVMVMIKVTTMKKHNKDNCNDNQGCPYLLLPPAAM